MYRKPYRKLSRMDRALKRFYFFWLRLSPDGWGRFALVLAVFSVFVWWFGLFR